MRLGTRDRRSGETGLGGQNGLPAAFPSCLGRLAAPRSPLVALLILRLLVAWILIDSAIDKFGRFGPNAVQGFLSQGLFDNPNAWFVTLANNLYTENIPLIAKVVPVLELALGCAALLGIMIRLVAPLAVFMHLNYYFLVGHVAVGNKLANELLVAIWLTFFIASPGRVLGVDGWLKRRFAWAEFV